MADIPAWAQILAMGFALWAWLEARVVLRKECKIRHDQVDAQLTSRHDAIKELRSALQPLVLQVGALKAHVSDLKEEMRALREWLEKEK